MASNRTLMAGGLKPLLRVLALLGLLCLGCWQSALAQSIRLALVANEDPFASAADLLTVSLSRQKSVTVLERDKVLLALREQRLSLAGLTSKDYLRMGEMLGADGLFFIGGTDASRRPSTVCVRLVAVQPAVIAQQIEYPWPLPEPELWAERVWIQFRDQIPKLSVPARDAVPLSVLNLRSSVSSRQSKEAENELTRLVIDRLAKEPAVFVLERSRLQSVAFEKELNPADPSPFWTGRYLLDGTLDPHGFEPARLALSARLIPPNGGTPTQFEVSGPRNDLPAVAEALSVKLLSALNRKGAASWQPQAEAEQYFQEAVWALRWKLPRQAQNASESAWALGLRTRTLSLLRINSYVAEDWGHGIGAAPNPDHLQRGLRALDLFCQDAPRFTTNRPGLDPEMSGVGVSVLERASGLLDGFYSTAEMRQGREAELAEFRAAAQRVAALVDPDMPGVPYGTRWGAEDDNPNSGGPGIARLKWLSGGLWFDKPEQALGMHRQMVEQGWRPFHLPLVIGWSWNDRKRVPQLLRQFVADLSHSTNADVRLEGLFLALARAPLDSEGSLEAREKELLDTLWLNRDRFYAGQLEPLQRRIIYDISIGEKEPSLLCRAEWVLKAKYHYPGSLNFNDAALPPFGEEPFVGFVDRLRRDFLARAPVYDERVFRALFPCDPAKYDDSQAREYLPLLEQFRTRLALPATPGQSVNKVIRLFQSRAPGARPQETAVAPAASERSAAARLKGDASGLQVIRFTDLEVKPAGLEGWPEPLVANAIFRSGRLWLQVTYSRPGTRPDQARTVYVGADLRTGQPEIVPFPPEHGRPDPSLSGSRTPYFEVTRDCLLVSAQTKLYRYQFRDQRWDSITLPTDRGAAIREVRGSLFLTTTESFLELQPDLKTLELLAGSRRRPAANPLDELTGFGNVFPGPNQSIGVSAGGRLFTFRPPERKFVEIPGSPLATGPIPLGRQSSIGNQGLLWLIGSSQMTGSHPPPARLFAVWKDREVLEPLLEQGSLPGSNAAPVSVRARWNWPEPYVLGECAFAMDGEEVYALSPRTRSVMAGSLRVISLGFEDARNATLLRFGPDRPDPVCIALQFAKGGEIVDPFNPVAGGMQWRLPGHTTWLGSPDGLLLAGPTGAGYWLIPRSVQRGGEGQPGSNRAAVPTTGSNATGTLKR